MALPLSRAARVRVIPFAVFMGLLALRGALPADGSWGIDPRWIYGLTVVVVGALLAWWWREYGELSAQVLPSIVGADPRRYAGMGLRDLCQQLHAAYRQHGMAEALRRIYAVQPEVVLKPADAYDCLVRGEVEAVPLEQLEGRIAAVMLVPYPPGIPLLMPGERFARGSRPLIDYLAFTMHLAQQFPGFAAEVHGLQRAAGGCTVDCLRRR